MQFWSGTAFLDTHMAVPLAQMLDQNGFDGVISADHMIYPRELSSPYPSPTGIVPWQPETAWPDSWVLIGAMAAVTRSLRFTNAIYVGPSRPLVQVAKQVATAAVLSNGRVTLTLGAGWMKEEFDLMGQDFHTRGKRLDEMIPALRELWKGGWVSWSGEHYQVPELMLEPHPEAPVPIMCGGESEVALRRAAQLCDGWVGTAYTLEQARPYVETLTKLRHEYGRSSEPFDIMVALLEPQTVETYRRAEEMGITQVMCAPWIGADDDRSSELTEAERFRRHIEHFADTVIAGMR
ncbi:TIGR03619 family F420-dependent LLM class oxidoreductase [Mycobacterium sp. OTB74]|uniref:TIGR03619 family F420-dependent LLM class oxidoreductase n=1 Tax=Mycobacterium sp. OTB74 TaxID=1853452 RepID=UPI00247689F3|nr:TIGR03619 family F420-dependent LLM class oxidoreductase [Mycobacterium sp. OTB74]MDH6244086.1 putative F420-dependent oxidoreductase [Mycobacterium sp. OTB74]